MMEDKGQQADLATAQVGRNKETAASNDREGGSVGRTGSCWTYPARAAEHSTRRSLLPSSMSTPLRLAILSSLRLLRAPVSLCHLLPLSKVRTTWSLLSSAVNRTAIGPSAHRRKGEKGIYGALSHILSALPSLRMVYRYS